MDHITKVLRLKKSVKCKTEVIASPTKSQEVSSPPPIGKDAKKLILDNSRWEASQFKSQTAMQQAIRLLWIS